MYSLGIDIGGTSIKASLYRQEKDTDTFSPVAEALRYPTPSDGSYRSMLDLLHRIIDHHLGIIPREQSGEEMQIGIGTPGLVDNRGYLRGDAVNIPGWTGVQLKDEVSAYAAVDVRVANDVNMAAYAEWRLGAGRGSESMVFISLGTGIGSGIILNGRPAAGHTGMAGEIGHLVVEPGGRQCKCGLKGCLERYSSASGIALSAEILAEQGEKELNGPLRTAILSHFGTLQKSSSWTSFAHTPSSQNHSSQDFASQHGRRESGAHSPGSSSARRVYEALAQGDPLARAVHDSSSRRLAQGVAAVAHMLNPQVIVLGGGVLAAGDVVIQGVQERIHEFLMPMALKDLEIRRTHLGPDAGMLGAAAMAADFAR